MSVCVIINKHSFEPFMCSCFRTLGVILANRCQGRTAEVEVV